MPRSLAISNPSRQRLEIAATSNHRAISVAISTRFSTGSEAILVASSNRDLGIQAKMNPFVLKRFSQLLPQFCRFVASKLDIFVKSCYPWLEAIGSKAL